MATIHSGSDADLIYLAEVLQHGGVVAVPTETVYGLAANALDAAACRKVFEIKGRPAHDPFIVHVHDRRAADEIAQLNQTAETLAANFWPGPLTLILPKRAVIPDIVTSGRPTVAVRMPAHPLFHCLLRQCNLPLAAPSANPFGYVSPTSAAHVQTGIGVHIDHILDGGPCAIGVESTIIDVRDERNLVILRPGGTPREDLENALGQPIRLHQNTRKPGANPPGGELAPGMLDKHYSPRTPVALREAPFAEFELEASDGIARVCYRRPAASPAGASVFWLSEKGDEGEAARRLFALMRQLDEGNYSCIEFEPAPASGLGPAINDRLRRAAR